MMRFCLIIAAALTAIAACAQPKAQWIDTTYDYGAFAEDDSVSQARWRVVNVGTEPLVIVSASATCGCTTPIYDMGEIAPGDTACVRASYNPEGRPGRFSKQVYVRTNAGPERQRLDLKGVVIGNERTIGGRYPVDMGALKLRNGAVMMGKVPAGKGKTEFAEGYNQSRSEIVPAFKNVPKYLQVSASPAAVGPGDLVSFSVYFRGDKCKEWGLVTDSLQVCPEGLDGECYWLPVVAIIEEDFSKLSAEDRLKAPRLELLSDRVDLGKVPMRSTTPIKTRVKLFNQGKKPLLIRRVYSQDPAVTVKAQKTTIKPGKSVDLTLEYDPSKQPTGLINTRFSIITNDPAVPMRTIRIVAERSAAGE